MWAVSALVLLSAGFLINCQLTVAAELISSQEGVVEGKTSVNNGSGGSGPEKDMASVPENSTLAQRRSVKLNRRQGLMMNQILAAYSLGGQLNELCKNHSKEFALGLRAFEPWALQMFDSSSKLQSGILDGNLWEFGAFKQCIQVYKNSQYGPIRGKHCSLRVRPDVNLLRKILEFRNISSRAYAGGIFTVKQWDNSWTGKNDQFTFAVTDCSSHSLRFVKVHQFVKNATFVWALCVPASCDSADILHHFTGIIYGLSEGLNLSISVSESDCSTNSEEPFSAVELSVIGVLASFLGIVAVFTIVDLYSTPEEASSSSLVNVFSACKNSRQIFAKGRGASDLDCVHGIRFLSTCYVVIGHRYLMLMFFPVVNSLRIMDWVLLYRSTAITGGTLCVDTFFMVSGMLVSVGFCEEMAKSGRMNWALFYLYRYMRITPPLAVVVLCYATLVHHLGSGPLWRDMLEILQKPCREYWWATLLHIQNYVHPFPLCMTQVWYLTCDMQYYFFSPLVLLPLWKWPLFGYVNYTLIYSLSVASNFYFAWINRYDGGVPVTNQLFSTKYFQHHYIAPHTRAATYIIGLGFGYSIYKSRGRKIQISYPLAVAGWMASIATLLASLVGCHSFHLEEHDYNRLEASIYLSCSRSAWTFGLVWMVWACINGYGGPINSILSSHIFRVLGRISYGIYLLHMLMQYLTSGAAKMPGYFSDFSALYAAFSDLFIMIIIGFAFTVCFESPLVRVLALVLRGSAGRSRKIDPKPQQVVRN